MVPLFTEDVDGKPLNNKHLLPRRNWCGITVSDSPQRPFELDVTLNVEVDCHDSQGITKPYQIKIPTLTV